MVKSGALISGLRGHAPGLGALCYCQAYSSCWSHILPGSRCMASQTIVIRFYRTHEKNIRRNLVCFCVITEIEQAKT
ncbi:hypothetical protein Desaf_0051 [Desulfocurvibacter africanus subsp. africanus str. Walvis Bay]|uniref:Uncharacterized protein n=1 Tax=Desulfocurvibacter africanus subsp. africanus str. Walvis Bay TaxID=690850 RepID=F3YV98_DESAF|nr:hypothetical protein Desaf_0051 [Desulfocurvibacter africanus subsp. africanus str. Walvis Bay]